MNKLTGGASYRKFKADYLFDGFQLLDGSQVLVTDTEGTVKEIVPAADAGDDVEIFTGIVSPGFINCHCHLELSHMKGLIPEKTGLIDFVLAVLGRRQADENEILAAIESAETSMISQGIVAVGDICNTRNTLLQKQKKLLDYYNFIELSGWAPNLAGSRFMAGMTLYADFKKMSGKDEHLALTPHAPYSVSDDLWTLMSPFFKQKTISIHNQESPFENDFFLNGAGGLLRLYEIMKINNPSFVYSGKTSIQTYFPKMQSARHILLVHNTFIKTDDLAAIESSKDHTFFCLCPNANLYIENVLPPVDLLRRSGSRIVLGTDSLASNRQLSILEEMKTILLHHPEISSAELLRWATSNGAAALQYDQTLGSFRPGKKPGILRINHLAGTSLTESSSVSRLL